MAEALQVIAFVFALIFIIGAVGLLLLGRALPLLSGLLADKRYAALREWDERRRERNRAAAGLISTAWVFTLLSLAAAGITAIVLYAARYTMSDGLRVASTATAIAAAALMAGTLVGFLFGIPRSLQDARQPKDTDNPAPSDQGNGNAGGYRANTNLEQISDWLTKILVGVGLTEIGNLPDGLKALARWVAPALSAAAAPDGGRGTAGIFGVALTLYFLQAGFIYGYIWARVNLARAFREADLAAVGQQAAKLVFEAQSEKDALALNLVSRQLEPSPDMPAIPAAQLRSAIQGASPAVKVQIFNQARRQRTENWRNDSAKVARTIPIFQALVEDEPNRFHRNYGQLGFALKDQTTPDWAAAERALTKAISLRGDPQEHGGLMYEFNRAVCLIELNAAFSATKPSSPEDRARILEDLRVVYKSEETRRLLGEAPVLPWRQLNSITEAELTAE